MAAGVRPKPYAVENTSIDTGATLTLTPTLSAFHAHRVTLPPQPRCVGRAPPSSMSFALSRAVGDHTRSTPRSAERARPTETSGDRARSSEIAPRTSTSSQRFEPSRPPEVETNLNLNTCPQPPHTPHPHPHLRPSQAVPPPASRPSHVALRPSTREALRPSTTRRRSPQRPTRRHLVAPRRTPRRTLRWLRSGRGVEARACLEARRATSR